MCRQFKRQSEVLALAATTQYLSDLMEPRPPETVKLVPAEGPRPAPPIDA